jgi:transposase InsO family protein
MCELPVVIPAHRCQIPAAAGPPAQLCLCRPRHPLCPSRNPRRSPGRHAAAFLARFPLEVHTILTDNGSEFTDRFTVDKKAKPQDRPSGDHAFDRVCAARAIAHRLTQPFRPQTNGMVERFNRRLGEHLARMPQNRAAHHGRFLSHAERDARLHTFVADYNRTRFRCLDYQAPAELLAKLAGHNTKAGAIVPPYSIMR